MSLNRKIKMPTTIQNLPDIAITPEREKVLSIIHAGIDAIDTENVLRKQICLEQKDGKSFLKIKGQEFDLDKYRHVYVLGFGKASSKAAEVVDSILGDVIDAGVVISIQAAHCDHIEVITGTHPLPSLTNVVATKKIITLAENAKEDDLVICLISGGGSALLCGDEEEADQGVRLYNEYLKTNGEIIELNTVRKHISILKGGGLAKLVYPATLVGLIFSDIAGDNCDFITSGPTYKDKTTVADAQKIIEKYGLDNFTLIETPKDDVYFKNVSNIVMISNIEALEGMTARATALGLRSKVASSAIYTSADEAVAMLQDACALGEVVLAGGEIRVLVDADADVDFGKDKNNKIVTTTGPGGRCHYLGMSALPTLRPDETFCAFATDGVDNSNSAGVIIDSGTRARAEELGLNSADYKAHFAGYTFFNKLGHEQIFTGITQSNVSDLMVLFRK